MKFLFVSTTRDNGGAETHFVALAKAMAETGHAVDALVRPRGAVELGLAHSKVRVFPALFRNVFDLRGYAAALKAIRRQRPDVLVGGSGKEYWPLLLLGRCLRIPVALFRHRTPPMNSVSGYLVPRMADHFLAVSKYARQVYIQQKAPAARVQVLYNPVDMAAFRPHPQRRLETLRALGLDEDAIVIGYFGRIHGGKGIFTLLDAAHQAMAREPRLRCLWVGDGMDLKKLRAQIAGHPFAERHRLLGWVDDASPYYNALSMLAFPSVKPETFGRVSIEAQASGVPVLCSDIGGAPETLVPNVTGLLLPPGNVDAWRDAILALCDESRRQAMSSKARDFVQSRFSTRIVASEFMQILNGPRMIDTTKPTLPRPPGLSASRPR
jgi:glycosyltransferase involved in cell wall biosynthesis